MNPSRPDSTGADNPRTDNPEYLEKKRFFEKMLTIYGRKPCLEALRDDSIPIYRLHLADSNQSGGIVAEIEREARRRGLDIQRHSREALSRISRNGRQDQGVALDLMCPQHIRDSAFIATPPRSAWRLIALDGVTNPQNVGMIVRSVAASPCDGLLVPASGTANLTSPLVNKASAGTLFKCPIVRCGKLVDSLRNLQQHGARIVILSGEARQTLSTFSPQGPIVYVLGNETSGVSNAVRELADIAVSIPMHNGVESLNVAVTAALLAFRESL